MWRPVVTKVSLYALKLALKQFQLLPTSTIRNPGGPRRNIRRVFPPRDTCSHAFSRTMGIPCSHQFYDIVCSHHRALEPTHFSSQWWLSNPAPSTSSTTQSTHLDPSQSAFQTSINSLWHRYEQWPQIQQREVIQQIQEISSQPTRVIEHPRIIQNTRGRPSSEKDARGRKKKGAGVTGTRREASGFEIAE